MIYLTIKSGPAVVKGRRVLKARLVQGAIPAQAGVPQDVIGRDYVPKAEVAANYLYRNTLRVTRVTRKDG